jgi:lipopolysaccharide biosynthesis glycosyltransferase
MNAHIYIGYDPRENAAYEVAEYSIRKRAAEPVAIHKLALAACPMLTRPIERREGKLWCPISGAHMATEFAISRFCIPFFSEKGWALFMDCDMLCLEDIGKLFALADDRYAMMVVKHNQKSGPKTKMDGQVQSYYARKNWSSVMLWNCAHPAHRRLTVKDLNSWPGRDLHAMKWLQDDEIGALPAEWNWLVGVTVGDFGGIGHSAKLLHYTLGGPWFDGWKPAPLDELWIEEYAAMRKDRA